MTCSLSNYTQDLLLLAISKSKSEPLRLEVADRPFVNKCFHKEEKRINCTKPNQTKPNQTKRRKESNQLYKTTGDTFAGCAGI